MKVFMSCGAAVVLLACAAIAGEKGAAEKGAAEKGLKSGLQVGDSVGAFDVIKCGGVEDDGVSFGQKLCYR
jgi:hypothetical protein